MNLTTLFLLPTLFLAACEATNPVLTAGTGGMDMFSPVKMRLHPLSRVVSDNAATPTIEARLEFTDQFGDVTKSPGSIYFEVFRYQTFTPNHHGDRVNLYSFQLSTPETNKEHWDPTIRTYLFQLSLPADAFKPGDRMVLSATLNVGESKRLQDDMTLTLK
ncbi:MAG: hypothetical protein FWD53_05680 [Phycisphaerales bacterium]|nr:hypothetical protein [Phycisphaerales bacterium]